jgi:hypothetical protein
MAICADVALPVLRVASAFLLRSKWITKAIRSVVLSAVILMTVGVVVTTK